jgi:predicted O-linked N-acetylglucosamine transferase (SPINDLY family)
MASFERAIAASPGDSRAISGIADCAAQLSDWTKRAEVEAMLPDHLAGVGFVTPFVMLGYSDDPLLQQKNACHYAASAVSTPSPVWTGGKWRHDKIRVAYLSADYRTHPIGHVMADLIETHDRTRFEIVGISYSDDDGSGIRKRIAAAFDSFHEVRGIDDRRVAKLLRDLEIDIAVDLQGYTGNERPGVFESRAAPIQASYLGYPSTLGAPLVDYIIADRLVLPFDQQQFYEEQIVHLPNCYLVADRKRTTDDTAPTRQEMGLPDRGFVFVCFNGNWKITPAMFDCWMAILRDVEGSVLWLVGNIEAVRRNLAREATRRGIDPARLVFARRLPTDRHLARHALADLFLDTLPYNAHSTGQDALRTGLPVLTCIGRAFPARVGASLLHAVGLPELAVPTLEEYRALAVALACDPARLAAVKAKLRRNLATHPLLDTALFARGMEFAFRTMWEIWQRGERPRSFAVASDVSP